MTTNLTTKQYSKTLYLVLCGLFAALTAICSFINIPLGFTPIPVNLGTLAVFLTGGILGKKYGTISMTVYVLLGAVGVPVFSGFRGGLGVLAGPTGGYIIGYVAAAFVIGLLIDKLPNWLSMLIGLTICYILGTAWFMISTGTALWASLVSCVFPFLIGDALKIFVAALLVKKLRPMLN